jgi:hypothetical protein
MERRTFLAVISGSLPAAISLDAGAGQSENTASAVGVETIKRVLTGQKQWKLYWNRVGGRPRIRGRTSDRTPSATLEFMRAGRRLVARQEADEVHHAECEFEVTVKEDGFIFEGCWGSDKTMTYDPDDREYPFKGRYNGTLLWLAPSE